MSNAAIGKAGPSDRSLFALGGLVVDKSGSMGDLINGSQKWATMRSALGTTLDDNVNKVNLRLMLYPANDVCAGGSMTTTMSGTSNGAINAALGSVSPGGSTPTHTSLQNALSCYQGTPTNPNGRFALLATDGEQNCLNVVGPTIPTVNE
ncbi:MAG: VWA domain-containing protein [Myxococcales bacterium]|nr:VWA domain-containing protein [Myxococcales bacterium]